jgi:tRNA pseudouridine38-40 synthase
MGRTYRTAYKAEVHQRGDMVIFEIAANSFLPHQVRNTVGGLIKVGLGKTEVEEFCNLARSGQTRVIGPAVPAHGLCLMKVEYPCFPPLEKGDEDL